MTDVDPTSAEAIEFDLAALAEHGVGCPRAVQLGGPGKVRDWIDGEFSRIEIERQAKTAVIGERMAAQAERTDPETGDVGESVGEFLDRKLGDDDPPPMATRDEVTEVHERVTSLMGDVASHGGRLEAMERTLETLQEKERTGIDPADGERVLDAVQAQEAEASGEPPKVERGPPPKPRRRTRGKDA